MAEPKKKKRGFHPAYIGLIIGFLMIAYFPAAELINAYNSAKIVSEIDINQFVSADDTAGQARQDAILAEAHAYNDRLAGKNSDTSLRPYGDQLTADGETSAFGYVIIPQIAVTIPVYHGTSESVLAMGAGHIEGTSLPVGGDSTHSVISAHSGSSQTRAFDDIRLLETGDYFAFKTWGQTLGYKVVDIQVVEPDRTDLFAIQPGRDLMTLVTCTPYGINSHRLLVTGERAELPEDFFDQTPSWQDFLTNRRVWPVALAALCLLLFFMRGRFGMLRLKLKSRRGHVGAAAGDAAQGGLPKRRTRKRRYQEDPELERDFFGDP